MLVPRFESPVRDGTSSIVAPIADAQGRVVAALGLVTTSHRRELIRLAPAVQLGARGIGRSIAPAG